MLTTEQKIEVLENTLKVFTSDTYCRSNFGRDSTGRPLHPGHWTHTRPTQVCARGAIALGLLDAGHQEWQPAFRLEEMVSREIAVDAGYGRHPSFLAQISNDQGYEAARNAMKTTLKKLRTEAA